MLSIGTNPIYFYSGVTDMRKGFDGLSGLVSQTFPDKLLTGSFFVFINRRRNQMKVLYWDADGFVVFHKPNRRS